MKQDLLIISLVYVNVLNFYLRYRNLAILVLLTLSKINLQSILALLHLGQQRRWTGQILNALSNIWKIIGQYLV